MGSLQNLLKRVELVARTAKKEKQLALKILESKSTFMLLTQLFRLQAGAAK